MIKTEINNFLEKQKEVYNKISKIIGYNLILNYQILDLKEFSWCINNSTLYIKDEDGIYDMKINSYLDKGKRKFMGISDGYMYILVNSYIELDNDDSLIILLDTKLKNLKV